MSAQRQFRRTPLSPVVRSSAAETLHVLADGQDNETITVDEILTGLGNQGFGLLVLALALPNALPGPIIPGFSVPFSLGIILLGVQILQGHSRPLLPSWIRRRAIVRARFRRFVARAEPVLRRIERWFRPRSAYFKGRPEDRPRALGIILIIFAAVLAVPIPLGNGPEAFALCILGLGMFAGDERVELAGAVLGALTTLLNAGIVVAGVELAQHVAKSVS